MILGDLKWITNTNVNSSAILAHAWKKRFFNGKFPTIKITNRKLKLNE